MRISTLVFIILTISFLSRIFTAIGLPQLLNFVHFAGVFLLFIIAKPWTIKELFHINLGIASIIVIIILSAALNGAGLINVILEILLFCEPFLLLISIMSCSWEKKSLHFFKQGLAILCFFHIALCLLQFFVFGFIEDEVKGVFIGMGAGHHIGGAISMAFGIYWFISNKHLSLLNRTIIFLLSLLAVFVSDSKQVIAVSLGAFAIGTLYFFSGFRFINFLKNLIIFFISSTLVFAIGKKLYPPLLIWLNSTKLIPGFVQKLSVFNLITSNYDNFFCWLVGVGPGHTISRLAWLMDDYGGWLYLLGATTSKVTKIILYANEANWLSNSSTGSSIFSLMFSYAGIWGDIGILGLMAYLYCLFIVFHKYCTTVLDRYWILCIFIYGITFAWLEEPCFMLFVICLLGISWQEHKNAEKIHIEKINLPNLSMLRAVDENSINS